MSTCELKKALESSDQLDFENYLDSRETHQIIADIKALVGEKIEENEALRDTYMYLQRMLYQTQAQLDRLMLEFCPDEMTPEQMREWEQSQRLAGRTLGDLAPAKK